MWQTRGEERTRRIEHPNGPLKRLGIVVAAVVVVVAEAAVVAKVDIENTKHKT